jgi:hypothetical protein
MNFQTHLDLPNHVIQFMKIGSSIFICNISGPQALGEWTRSFEQMDKKDNPKPPWDLI